MTETYNVLIGRLARGRLGGMLHGINIGHARGSLLLHWGNAGGEVGALTGKGPSAIIAKTTVIGMMLGWATRGVATSLNGH